MIDYSEHLISMAGGDGEADVLGEIEARAQAATSGPWGMAVSADRKWALILVNAGTETEFSVARSADDDDASFIAHARADIPALLAMVREQRAVIERVREWADKFEANQPSVYTVRDDNQFDKGSSSGRRSAGAIIRAALAEDAK